MQVYDAKTVAVNAEVRQSYIQIAQDNPRIYANQLLVPKIAQAQKSPALDKITRSESASVFGIVK
jgi:NAD(P)H-quinone oxidoreductase subunit 4